uniref:Putative secreted protein n=1 Tax=Ixodes ricinus TaxID=34613 RepID=A0A6B0U8Z5_IXORI
MALRTCWRPGLRKSCPAVLTLSVAIADMWAVYDRASGKKKTTKKKGILLRLHKLRLFEISFESFKLRLWWGIYLDTMVALPCWEISRGSLNIIPKQNTSSPLQFQ